MPSLLICAVIASSVPGIEVLRSDQTTARMVKSATLRFGWNGTPRTLQKDDVETVLRVIRQAKRFREPNRTTCTKLPGFLSELTMIVDDAGRATTVKVAMDNEGYFVADDTFAVYRVVHWGRETLESAFIPFREAGQIREAG